MRKKEEEEGRERKREGRKEGGREEGRKGGGRKAGHGPAYLARATVGDRKVWIRTSEPGVDQGNLKPALYW